MALSNAGDVQVRRGTWWRVLVIGILIYAVGIVLLLATQNPYLFPTVIMVGNLAVPVAVVSFFYERRHLSRITMGATVIAFLWGGLLGRPGGLCPRAGHHSRRQRGQRLFGGRGGGGRQDHRGADHLAAQAARLRWTA